MSLSDVNPDVKELVRQIKKFNGPLTCKSRRERRPDSFAVDDEEENIIRDTVHGISLGRALCELQKIHSGNGDW